MGVLWKSMPLRVQMDAKRIKYQRNFLRNR